MESEGLSITIKKGDLNSVNVRVPCDTSSSAFWLVAGCCHPNAKINLQNVGMNPTRTGVLEVLENMGADILVKNERMEGGEPVADLVASSSNMEAVEISGDIIPRVVDELPVLSLAACFAKGTTLIKDAQELRVKESDRISSTVDILAKLGADIEETDDGMKIKGGRQLEGTTVSSHGDHRIAMTSAIAGLVSTQETIINGAEAASVSYPTFWDSINSMQD